MFTRLMAALNVVVAVSGIAHAAEEYPSLTLLRDTVQNSALNIECSKDKNGTLNCSFVQLSVRPEAKASDLETKLKKDVEGYLKETARDKNKKTCKEYKQFLELYEAAKSDSLPRNTPTIINVEAVIKSLATMHPRQKEEMLEQIKAVRDASCNPSRKSAEKVIKLSHDKSVRTCRVSTFKFEQSFKHDHQSGNWISVSPPHGVCGKIHVSTFIKDWPFGRENSMWWKYVTKKTVTNKDAKDPLLGSCKNWDEGEYTYTMESRELYMGCDYIKFSVF